jgi:DUF2950 family protein
MLRTKLLISTDGNIFMRKFYTYLALSFLVVLLTACGQATTETGQYYYETKEQASDALVNALISKEAVDLQNVLGAEYRQLIPADQAENMHENIKQFLNAWNHFHTLLSEDDSKVLIEVGSNHWTFPVPIIREDKGWRFDAIEGLAEINNRQIGRNELSVIQASLAYSDAQQEYIQQDFDNDGVFEYAQKFISSTNNTDGLYWPTAENEKPSPLGPLFADVTPSGAYHGYYYKILTGQGSNASGGAHSYLVDDKMTTGYGLIAWPAEYGVTGVMSFKLSQNGILYEADLGPDTQIIVESLILFDPDEQWNPTAEEFL